MSQISRKVECKAFVERFTLHDKKSAFRVSEPPKYIVRFCVQTEHRIIIANEFVYHDKMKADEHTKRLRECLNI